MVHEYPYTNYEDGCDMNCFMGMCHRAGVKLAVVGDSLQLLDKKNFVLSQVKISVAQSALKDELGHDLTAYLISAGKSGDYLIFTDGQGNETSVEVPYAVKALKDVDGQNITSYIKNISIAADKLRVTLGDNSAYEITVPYAIKAFTDVNDKPLTTYGASIEVSGNDIVLKDGMGTVINTITVHYAERASADESGNNIKESYGSTLQAGTTTIKLISKDGTTLSDITVPYATVANQDTNGNLFLHDYAESLVVDNDGKRIDLVAHDGTILSAVTVPFSTVATDATNAIERAEIVGDKLVLTTYGGQVTRLEIPWALRAGADKLDNQIDESYVADVRQDATTGVISFYAMNGSVLAELTPNSRVAEYDTFDNLIGDFVKTLVFDNQSKYLIATHGTGDADSIRIEYATSAWKDDIGNIIKNVYHKTLLIEEDNEGRWNLVGLNGEGSEITRLILPELTAAVGSGLVINQHNISLTNEVKERIYDFDYVTADERLDISTHVLTT